VKNRTVVLKLNVAKILLQLLNFDLIKCKIKKQPLILFQHILERTKQKNECHEFHMYIGFIRITDLIFASYVVKDFPMQIILNIIF